jgi:hypothetical protein
VKPDPAAGLPEPDFRPPPLPPAFPRWKHFAWDGWCVEIPVDWDLGALEVSPQAGYFRLDDEFEPRLMVKWQPIRGDYDPRKAIERYLRKTVKKAAVDAKLGAPVPGISGAFKHLEHETYTLAPPGQPHRKSWGISASCPKCQRAFVVEMTTDSRAGGSERQVARVLGSLLEHSEDKLARWEAYGLSFDLPVELRAAGSRFSQGLVSMAAAERGRRVEVTRWTLASAQLSGRDLRAFLESYLKQVRNTPRLTIGEAAVLSHPGLHFHSNRRVLESVRTGLRKALALYQPVHQTGLIWHCVPSNRIFMLALSSNQPNDIGAARVLASRVRCCRVLY